MCNGSATAGGVPRVIDRSGHGIAPIGIESFDDIVERHVYVDKTLLAAELYKRGGVTLFCRPRRFGKSTALRMLRSYFEVPVEGWVEDRAGLFDGLAVSEQGGRAAEGRAAHPVVYLSLNACGGADWDIALSGIADAMRAEFARHGYLRDSPKLLPTELDYFDTICGRNATEADLQGSLAWLASILRRHHSSKVVILIDEYDKMATESFLGGYREEAIAFLKRWLTGALKATDDLRLAALTGVQRVSKESIFSDLNNFRVDTTLDHPFSEAFGFTRPEIEALAAHLGNADKVPEIAEWYDGYCFGGEAVYNPWSALNYLDQGCVAQPYWTNTSSNDVVRRLIARADEAANADLTELAEGGEVSHPLDLSVIFGELDSDVEAVWPQLYLAGYVTTDDVAEPNRSSLPRRLRVPNLEVRELFSDELVARARLLADGRERSLRTLHAALAAGDAEALGSVLEDLLKGSSYHDLQDENSLHMWLLGLLYGVPGYRFPKSNRESGEGRPDITLEPVADRERELPAVVVEAAFEAEAPRERLAALAAAKLADQVEAKRYGADLAGAGLVRLATAFDAHKHAVTVGATDRTALSAT